MKNDTSIVSDDPEVLDAEEAARTKALKARLREWLGLVFVLVVAAAFRFTGITWGLPNSHHFFSYHPDETVILFHSLPVFSSVNLFSTEWFQYVLPHFYNYGSLQLYLVNIVTSIASAYNVVGGVYAPDGSLNYEPIAKYYLIGRCLTAVMGIATVWAVWATGKRLWGPIAGFSAALLLAFMPLHVQHSHYITVDVPATLWVTLSLYWSARVLKDDNLFVMAIRAPKVSGATKDDMAVPPRSRWASPWVLAGLFAGLAMATKYNAALVLLPMLVAGHYRRREDFAGAVKGAISGVLAFVSAFIIGCPGAIFDTKRFLADVKFEGTHVYQHGLSQPFSIRA